MCLLISSGVENHVKRIYCANPRRLHVSSQSKWVLQSNPSLTVVVPIVLLLTDKNKVTSDQFSIDRGQDNGI